MYSYSKLYIVPSIKESTFLIKKFIIKNPAEDIKLYNIDIDKRELEFPFFLHI